MNIKVILYASLLGASLAFANVPETQEKTPLTLCLESLEKLKAEIPDNAFDAKTTFAEVSVIANQMAQLEAKRPKAPALSGFEKPCSLYVALIKTQSKTQAVRNTMASLWQERVSVMENTIAFKDTISAFYNDQAAAFASALKEEKALLALTSEELKQRALAREDSIKAAAQARELELKKALAEEVKKAEERQQEARNKLNNLQSKLIQVTEDARGIILSMSDILFDVNKASLKADLKTSLAKVSGILSVYQDLNVSVEGHTDNTGSEDHNLKLSEQRAQNVLDFLVVQGIDAARLTSKGFGMSVPIADNESKEGRQKNRRVDLVIKDKAL